MHAVIYGTGNWAKLIGSKLEIPKYYVGSCQVTANFTRKENLLDIINDSLVFIASETKNHFSDLRYALNCNPRSIFVEKGFSSKIDYINASKISKEIPVYVMNQYRYSKIFEYFKLNYHQKEIKACLFDMVVDSDVKEWGYHIASLDNYIRDKKNMFLVTSPNTYKLDDITSIRIQQKNFRDLKVYLKYDDEEIEIQLGKDNIISYKSKNRGIYYFEAYFEEDCLKKMIDGILESDVRLERV